MLEQLAGIETVILRGHLPPRLKFIIAETTKERPLSVLDPRAEAELREVLGLVEGPGILAALVGRILESVPAEALPEPELVTDIKTERELYDEAKAAEADRLVLLLLGETYVAYGQDAQQIAGATQSHMLIEGNEEKLGLPLGQQADWVAKIQEAQLDVVLMETDEEDASGYSCMGVLDMQTTEPTE